ncbi:MAG: acetate--CoA ligase [Acidimicrobiales bacterium]
MESYESVRAGFRWEDARARLDGLPGGGLNIAHEAVDRHVAGDRASCTALRWRPASGATVDLTYGELARTSSRFAGALVELGCGLGHGVATLLGRRPELYIAALGTLRAGGVYTPLFSAFGPEPVAMRLELGRIDVLVTTAPLYRRKVAPIRQRLVGLRHVILVGGGAEGLGDPTAIDWDPLLATAPERVGIAPTAADDRALLHFTSGTTGKPKGVIHVHGAVVAHEATGRLVLDIGPDDVYWCTADPGWVTGTSYGIIAPLVQGATAIVDEAELDAERWYRTLAEERVSVFYTAPTALRLLRRAGADVAASFDLGALRLVGSVGEPLDPETLGWAREVFGVPVLDTWWQTETGAIMIANTLDQPVKPGSMGRPVPGVTAGLLQLDDKSELALDDDGGPIEIAAPDTVGELALEAGWPSMFRGYLDQEERYRSSFVGPWYRSGDLARRDSDGYYWFVGRNNDLIKSAGHLIGPFEVESVLTEHPAVIEAGVIGIPDPTMGELVKAFVLLATGERGDDGLRRELMAHARARLGPAVAPRQIEFTEDLPHTRSGKIMRRLLKARELGLDEGDLSTLETGAGDGHPPGVEIDDGGQGR